MKGVRLKINLFDVISMNNEQIEMILKTNGFDLSKPIKQYEEPLDCTITYEQKLEGDN